MAGINQKLITVPKLNSFDDVRQALAKALGDIQSNIASQLPILDYQGKRITHVGAPQAADDVVTLKYLQGGGAQNVQPQSVVISTSGGGGGGGGSTLLPTTEIPAGTINGTNTLFTVTKQIQIQPYPILELNGVVQDPLNSPIDVAFNGTNVVYSVAPETSAKHVIWYWYGNNPILRARSFAGGTDQLNWGNSTNYHLLGNMSLGVWAMFPQNAFGILMLRGQNSLVQAGNTNYAVVVGGSSGSWDISYYHDYNVNLFQQHTFSVGMPNNAWRYVGISRDTTAKTVTCYVGNGATITSAGTYTYTNQPDGGTDTGCVLALGNQPGGLGGLNDGPLIGTLEEHYLSNTVWTSSDHLNAMNGTPNTSGLLLQCAMGNNPELDISGNAGSGTVTGTTLVQGH